MNKHILNTAVQDFITNYSDDITKLAFAGSPFDHITTQELIQQIESRNKIIKKLPTWYRSNEIYYPAKLHLEQTSSEITAQYKASLVKGNSLADLTGGFGVDAYYFSENFVNVDHFELNSELSEIAAHNMKILGKQNIRFINNDALSALGDSKYDVIYADPSRRHDSKGKVFYLKDCVPNIPENISKLFGLSEILLFKTSPMLDLSAGLIELESVFEIHIIAIDNDVKELLWLLKKDFNGSPEVYAVNIIKDRKEIFNYRWNEECKVVYSPPKRFLYEPNAAIMKSGAFDLLPNQYNIEKLHKHSHLYTSNTIVSFPGRCFLIDEIIPYKKAVICARLKLKKANITIRNFPGTVAGLRKKWNIVEGGEHYLFFTTMEKDQKVILSCRKPS